MAGLHKSAKFAHQRVNTPVFVSATAFIAGIGGNDNMTLAWVVPVGVQRHQKIGRPIPIALALVVKQHHAIGRSGGGDRVEVVRSAAGVAKLKRNARIQKAEARVQEVKELKAEREHLAELKMELIKDEEVTK